MKNQANCINTLGTLLLVVLTTYGCTSSKDIYQNPYQTGGSRQGGANRNQTSSIESSGQQPDWIYAVSKEFYVGYGQGNSVMKAKYAALNDIKAFITKSLGESGRVKEVTIVENSITGQNRTSGREDYLLTYDFENEYRPVVHISFDRFEDYYYHIAGYKARYYIKYNIDEDELQRIKEEFQNSLLEEKAKKIRLEKELYKSLQEEKARKIETKNSIDSLCSFQGLLSIESLLERYHGITDFIYTIQLDASDSLLLVHGLRNLSGFLSAVEITIIEYQAGELVRFGLISGNTLLQTKIEPIVRVSGVKLEELTSEEGIWEFRYRRDDSSAQQEEISIVFELPYDRLEAIVGAESSADQPEFQIVDQVLFSNIEQNAWNGRLQSLTVGFNIQSNSSLSHQIASIDLVIDAEGTPNPLIQINAINQELVPGISRVVRNADCQFPSRLIMRDGLTCDLKLYMEKDGSTHPYEFYNVPITINR